VVVSFLLGYGMKGKKPDWLMVGIFSLIISLTAYLILDLDRPRDGIITMDAVHHSMLDLRDMFKP
jgi:predicted Co/Zn/Cd cation transporter (cation efflux family)